MKDGNTKKRPVPLWGMGLALTVILLGCFMPFLGTGSRAAAPRASVSVLNTKLERGVTAAAAELSSNIVPMQQTVRTLSDSDLIAPKPDPEKYGTADTAEELEWLKEEAAQLIGDEELYFFQGRQLKPNSQIRYYLDDSILVITWKETVRYAVVTFAEVRIADGSQFRRFLADGKYGADTQYHTTEMAQTVNAVLASSGDFYRFRYSGIVIYDGTVKRVNTNKADTCCISDTGDLHFIYQDQLMTEQEAQKFADDNHIRFSLTFGPVLVDDHKLCVPDYYDLGEITSHSPRAGLCQLGQRHYLLATSNAEDDFPGNLTLAEFAQRLYETGCEKAYTLDGGQTAALALDGTLVNRVLYGQQRAISDIIYFATSVPEGD